MSSRILCLLKISKSVLSILDLGISSFLYRVHVSDPCAKLAEMTVFIFFFFFNLSTSYCLQKLTAFSNSFPLSMFLLISISDLIFHPRYLYLLTFAAIFHITILFQCQPVQYNYTIALGFFFYSVTRHPSFHQHAFIYIFFRNMFCSSFSLAVNTVMSSANLKSYSYTPLIFLLASKFILL